VSCDIRLPTSEAAASKAVVPEAMVAAVVPYVAAAAGAHGTAAEAGPAVGAVARRRRGAGGGRSHAARWRAAGAGEHRRQLLVGANTTVLSKIEPYRTEWRQYEDDSNLFELWFGCYVYNYEWVTQVGVARDVQGFTVPPGVRAVALVRGDARVPARGQGSGQVRGDEAHELGRGARRAAPALNPLRSSMSVAGRSRATKGTALVHHLAEGGTSRPNTMLSRSPWN